MPEYIIAMGEDPDARTAIWLHLRTMSRLDLICMTEKRMIQNTLIQGIICIMR